jgi:hypothetical protein
VSRKDWRLRRLEEESGCPECSNVTSRPRGYYADPLLSGDEKHTDPTPPKEHCPACGRRHPVDVIRIEYEGVHRGEA